MPNRRLSDIELMVLILRILFDLREEKKRHLTPQDIIRRISIQQKHTRIKRIMEELVEKGLVEGVHSGRQHSYCISERGQNEFLTIRGAISHLVRDGLFDLIIDIGS